MKIFQIILVILINISICESQTADQGYYKLKKARKQSELANGKAKVQLQFVGPTGQPVTSRIMFTMNQDSVIPIIDPSGLHTMLADAGKYKFNFVAPWWYNIQTDSIQLKSQTTTYIKVQFEAKEYTIPGL